jgi:uncharacterized protein YciI
MIARSAIAILFVLAAAGFPVAAAADSTKTSPPPESEMATYVVVLLNKGPAWSTADPDEAARQQRDHEAFVRQLVRTGTMRGAGTVEGTGDLREIVIFADDSVGRVRGILESDPAVRAGRFIPTLLLWWAAKGIGERFVDAVLAGTEQTLAPRTYQFGFLVRGPAWTPERTPEVERIQAGHMANINRLAAEGVLVAAGPFVNGGTYRGIFVFDVSSTAEADRLTGTDPAVAAKRLTIELHTWRTVAGVIPEPSPRTNPK